MSDIKIYSIQKEIAQIIKGKDIVIEKILACIFAGGHILLDDIPGVGKTTLANSISRSMGLNCKRISFTPDIMPSDITGFSMYNKQTNEFEFKRGPVFSNLFLADELNRTSPKTQSALLEVMEENNVTVDGTTYPLPSPFTVIATQNPYTSTGTMPLPDSLLDRFMVCLSMGYPSHKDSIEILQNVNSISLDDIKEIINTDELLYIKENVDTIFPEYSILEYITTLIEKTRDNEYIALGASPRASVNLLRISKAVALMHDRQFIIPEDIYFIFNDVLRHRIKLSNKAISEGYDVDDILTQIIKQVPVPKGK